MAQLTLNSSLGNALQQILMAGDMQPGDELSYQMAKIIYTYHPLGSRMVDNPIKAAQSQQREITVKSGPEEALREAFMSQWSEDGCDGHIANVMALSRIYGVASLAVLSEDVSYDEKLDLNSVYKTPPTYSVLDPLNTAGSLVLSQQPDAMDFQKVVGIKVNGRPVDRSRTVTIMNEKPIYLSYTTSAFGYVGRSVYQRALYPLKSYIQSMVTDDMVTRKAGVIIAKIKQPGSIVNNIMASMAGIKRNIVKEAQTDNVISITPDEMIETLNMQNLDGAYSVARKNILENLSASADMPAQLLTQDSLSAEFHEGTEDAKRIADYVDGVRVQMRPLYDFFDRIIMRRAWNPDFYQTIQERFPEDYKGKSYETALYEWENGFTAAWPNLLKEPDSELAKVDDIRVKTLLDTARVLMPECDPENKTKVIEWLVDNLNTNSQIVRVPLDLDYEEMAEFAEENRENMLNGMQGEEGGDEGPGKSIKPPNVGSLHDDVGKAFPIARIK